MTSFNFNTITFYAHRITGFILACYLCIHLCFLTTIVTGYYPSLIKVTLSKPFLPFDLTLFLLGIFHGVNGVRLIIHEFGFLYKYRETMLYVTFVLTFLIWIFIALIILGGVSL